MSRLNPIKAVLLFVAALNLTAGALLAQETGTPDVLNRASQYYLGSKDEILIKVNILGFIQRPGQYLVPRHTDLISLIAFAGGPREGANLEKVRIVRDAGFEAENNGRNGHNGHSGADGEAPVVTVNVKSYLEQGKKSGSISLKAGDTILIGQTTGHKVKSFLGINSVVALVLATATLLVAINQLSR